MKIATINNKFVNDKNAHYQWNIVFDKRINTQRTDNFADEVTRQVTIGGFQRLTNNNPRTGAPVPISTNDNNNNDDKGIASPKTKANLFSTRNLLSFQQHVNQQSNGMQMQQEEGKNNNKNQIKNALVILIGNTQQKEIELITSE